MAITATTGSLPLALAEVLSDKPTRMYMYMEYVNNAGDVPSITSAGGVTNFSNPLSYYLNLEDKKNYIRVPAIRNPSVSFAVNSISGESVTTYFAQSADTSTGILTGVGRSVFGPSSVCYGAALVLGLDETDHTKDIVIARAYFTNENERLTKSSASQLFVSFPLSIKVNAT
jgi:hypothetical protein